MEKFLSFSRTSTSIVGTVGLVALGAIISPSVAYADPTGPSEAGTIQDQPSSQPSPTPSTGTYQGNYSGYYYNAPSQTAPQVDGLTPSQNQNPPKYFGPNCMARPGIDHGACAVNGVRG